jgi:glutaredoxin
MSEPRITLYTRPGCHLCEDAKEAVRRVSDRTGTGWREVDIAGDDELENEYGEMIPVILLDGRMHGYFRVEEDRLLRDLGYGRDRSRTVD